MRGLLTDRNNDRRGVVSRKMPGLLFGFFHSGYEAGRIVVSLLVQNLPSSSGTMIETTRVEVRGP